MSSKTGRLDNRFQNATVAVSKIKHLHEAKIVWELRNWDHPTCFNVLKYNGSCSVNLSSGISLLFSLKDDLETKKLEEKYSSCLSLMASLLIKNASLDQEKSMREEGFTAKINVQYLTEKLEIAPHMFDSPYGSVGETCVSFGGPNSFPYLTTVVKKFIYIPKYGPTNQSPNVLRYGITVSTYNCCNLVEPKKESSDTVC